MNSVLGRFYPSQLEDPNLIPEKQKASLQEPKFLVKKEQRRLVTKEQGQVAGRL